MTYLKEEIEGKRLYERIYCARGKMDLKMFEME
jgi:hypothetical protein